MSASLAGMGLNIVPSQANFVWCTHDEAPVESIYRSLKQSGVLVRYMQYPGWGDGLRITVGADDQIDVLLAKLASML